MTIFGSFRLFRRLGSLDVDLFFVLFGGQAPRRVLGLRRGATLGARLEGELSGGLPLLGTRFFEAPMTSLFHGLTPRLEKGWNGRSVSGRPHYPRAPWPRKRLPETPST